MTDSAKGQVKAILAETARRKRIWAEMQKVAREVMTAVTAEARRRGIRGQNWVGGQYDWDHAYVTFPTYEARLDALTEARRPRTDTHSLRLFGSGTLERPTKGDAHEGYPNLVEDDPRHFRAAAVTELMGALNTYIQRKGRQGRGRRR